MSNKLVSPHFTLWRYLTNTDAVRGKLIRILSQILVVSKCMLGVLRPSFEVVKEGRIMKKIKHLHLSFLVGI